MLHNSTELVSAYKKYHIRIQFLVSIGSVALVSIICFFLTDFLGHRIVALLLLLAVSILAMLFEIVPVLTAAFLSALVWNYFFIPPIFTFHIENAEDLLMFLMYFAVALVNAVLTFKIKKQEKIVQEKQKKENIIKLYNSLLNSLSHELRTPISTIIGASDVLKDEQSQISASQKEKLVSEISSAGLRLNNQVDNLLNMSRLESGILNLKKDWCNINELIFSLLRNVEEDRGSHKIVFIPNEGLPFFKVDETLLYQALYNIVHNAILYTPEDSSVFITLSFENENCAIQITDDGPGFPESEIPRVFDKFYRLPNSRAGGTGLGLSIAKGFVQAHDGEILLKNRANGGAEFTVLVPAETSYVNHLKNE